MQDALPVAHGPNTTRSWSYWITTAAQCFRNESVAMDVADYCTRVGTCSDI